MMFSFLIQFLVFALCATTLGAQSKTRDDCSYVVAGKDASATHSVLVSYNNDFTGKNVVAVEHVEPTHVGLTLVMAPPSCRRAMIGIRAEGRGDSLTWGYMRVKVELGSSNKYVTENFMNEAGLSMAFGAYNYALPALVDNDGGDPFVSSGVGYEYWDLAAMYCMTPQCAMNLLQLLANACGFSEDLVGSMPVFTQDEAWNIEIFSGHNWIAKRIPDDQVLLATNEMTTRSDCDVNDPSTCRASPGIITLGINSHLYDPSTGPFDAAKCFSVPGSSALIRRWRLHNLFANEWLENSGYTYTTTGQFYPTTVHPDVPVTQTMLRDMARDHNEDTELARDYVLGSPHFEPWTPIDRAFKTYNMEFHPEGIPKFYLEPASACISAFLPFYANARTTPAIWRPDVSGQGLQYPFNTAKLIRERMDSNSDPLRYHDFIEPLWAFTLPWENSMQTQTDQNDLAIEATSSYTQKFALMANFMDSISASHAAMLNNVLDMISNKGLKPHGQ